MGKVALTDEELKRLKERSKGSYSIGPRIVESLIKRLDAAEAVCELVERRHEVEDYERAIAAWRKAAGKDKSGEDEQLRADLEKGLGRGLPKCRS